MKKDKTGEVVAALSDYCRLRIASLQGELYAINQLAKWLELLQPPSQNTIVKEDNIDWAKEVLVTLERSRTPLSKSAIVQSIESRLKTDHRTTMARVSIVLVNGKQNKISKIKTGKSYHFIVG